MNDVCSAAGDSTQPRATPASMTQILEFIDPSSLSPEVQQAIREIGPSLVSGLNLTEAAEQFGRRKDWARDRVALIRVALIEAALERADEMDRQLRKHLEALRSGSTA